MDLHSLPISYDRLSSTRVWMTDILEDMNVLYPLLSSSRPDIAEFRRRLDEQPRVQQLFPIFQRNRSTWPSTDPDTDTWWEESVDNAPGLAKLPSWLDTTRRLHIKPFGSRQSRMLIISSYPTREEHSTVHMNFAAANDLSNQSMSHMDSKFGFDREGVYPTSVCLADHFPVRLNRNEMLSHDVFQHITRILRDYWYNRTNKFFKVSKASIVVLSGRRAQFHYK